MITFNFLPQTLMLVQGASVAGICLAMAADEFFRPAIRRAPGLPAMAVLAAKQQNRRSRPCPQAQSGARATSQLRLSMRYASARVRPSAPDLSRLPALQPAALKSPMALALHSTTHLPRRPLAAG
jgi:hypothetical protein